MCSICASSLVREVPHQNDYVNVWGPDAHTRLSWFISRHFCYFCIKHIQITSDKIWFTRCTLCPLACRNNVGNGAHAHERESFGVPRNNYLSSSRMLHFAVLLLPSPCFPCFPVLHFLYENYYLCWPTALLSALMRGQQCGPAY